MPRERRIGLLKRVVPIALAASCCVATTLAQAQRCPPTPPDFHPQVHANSLSTLALDGHVRVHVSFWRVFCTTSRVATPAVHPREVIVTATDAHGATRPVTVNTRGSDWDVALPERGDFTLRISSRAEPSLEPATLRVRVPDRAALLSMRLRVRRPTRDASASTAGALSLRDADGYQMAALAVPVSRGVAAIRTSLPSGVFRAIWTLSDGRVRSTDLRVDAAGDLDVPFRSARLEVSGDWRPADGAMYRLTQIRDGRVVSHLPFDPSGVSADDDLQPGVITLVLESVARIEPWNSDAPGLLWRERYRENVTIAADASTRLNWSMPRILTEHRAEPTVASSLPALPGTAPTANVGSPADASTFGAFAVHDGVSVLIDANAWEYRDGNWSRLAWSSWFTSGEREAGTPNARVAFLDDARSWALADDGDSITFRTANGLAQESLALYSAAHAYPCRLRAIATSSARDIVAVGYCRPNAPASDTATREEGIIVTRDATHWSSPQWFDGAWFDVTRAADRIIAVGARGRVAIRDAGRWDTLVASDAVSLRRVSSGTHFVAALDEQGTIWTWPIGRIERTSAAHLAALSIRSAPRAIAQMCMTSDDRIAVWSAAWRRPNEGGAGPFAGAAAIAVWNARTSTWDEALGPADVEPLALACDDTRAYALTRENGRIVPIAWPLP